jgi:hypothetical protein
MKTRHPVSKFFRKLFGLKPTKQEQKEMAALLAVDIQVVLKKLENDTKVIDFTIQDILKKARTAKDQRNESEYLAARKQYQRKKGERLFLNSIHERLTKEHEEIKNAGTLSSIESILNSIKGLKQGFMSNTSFFDHSQKSALSKINSYILNAESISEDRLKSGDTFIDFLNDNFDQQLGDDVIEREIDSAINPVKRVNPIKD